jgi:hypothetical protein
VAAASTTAGVLWQQREIRALENEIEAAEEQVASCRQAISLAEVGFGKFAPAIRIRARTTELAFETAQTGIFTAELEQEAARFGRAVTRTSAPDRWYEAKKECRQ